MRPAINGSAGFMCCVAAVPVVVGWGFDPPCSRFSRGAPFYGVPGSISFLLRVYSPAGTRESQPSSNVCPHVRRSMVSQRRPMKHKTILFMGVFLFAGLVLLDESLRAGEEPELSKDDKK